MSKTRVIIIEDEFFAATHLKELVRSLDYWVVGVYHSGEDFLEKTDWRFDAAIVDIFLSENMSGLDVAEHLKERQKFFVFLTANQDSATLKTAARLAPAAYISKPFKPNDVAAALEIISTKLHPKIHIRGLHGIEELDPSDLLFVKSDGVYIEMHTRAGMTVQRKLLKEIEQELPPRFIRIHRSYLVNKDYIEHWNTSVVGIAGKELPVSRSYRKNLE